MKGWDGQVSPFVTLTIQFNADSPSVVLNSFRYNGSVDDHYNGFEAVVTPGAAGQIGIQASFEEIGLQLPPAGPTRGR